MTNVFERKFQELAAVSVIFGRSYLKLEVALLGIEISQQLRIGQKDIYVMALAVIDLQHHRCAATKRPLIDNGLFGVYLTDKSTSYSE